MLHCTATTATALPSHRDQIFPRAIGNATVSNINNNNSSNYNDQDNNISNSYNQHQQSSSLISRWEYEEITIERGQAGLGFTVAGGVDNPHYKNDNSIYITRFIPNGPAALDGRLKLEDIIVRVNDTDLKDVKHSEAVAALKNSGTRVQLLIKRRKSSTNIGTSVTNETARGISNHNISNKASKQQTPNINYNNKPNLTRSSTSAAPAATTTTKANYKLPPLPRPISSGPTKLRGTTQYSTTRENTTSFGKEPKVLRNASSSQSLQHSDDIDSSRIHNLFSEDNGPRDITSHNKISNPDLTFAKGITRLPRTVVLQRTETGLGINIVGGVDGGGTFISYIVPGGAAERTNKLHCGDQILSVNGDDLRFATHEEAARTLKQAGQTVKLVVKYRPEEYVKLENRINEFRERNMLSTGTLQTSQKRSLYARALFDYDPWKDSGLPSKGLSFKFGDILHITNASDDEWWQARKVLENGQDDIIHGIIPSKRRVEKRERSRLKTVKFINRNCSESTLDRRRKRFSFSKKFPFMKSRENMDFDEYDLSGSQLHSRGVLSSSSTISVNNSERGSVRNFTEEPILSYEPVIRQDINYARPVAIYGPVKEEIEGLRDDLGCNDRFFKMESIVPYTTRPPKEGELDGVKYHFISMQEMKRDLAKRPHKFVEAGELNGHYYGTSIDSIRAVAESGKHCLLNINPKALKKLHDANIHPIPIFIKPKSIESLLEMNKRWSQAEAIAAMERANRMEQEYGNYFTATVQQGTPDETLREVLSVISQHSGPKIWIPTTFEALNVAN